MGPDEMRTIGGFLARTIEQRDDEAALERLKNEVIELASAFPVPGISDRVPARA
jgi:glycine/serine hydroxymethyltransferase